MLLVVGIHIGIFKGKSIVVDRGKYDHQEETKVMLYYNLRKNYEKWEDFSGGENHCYEIFKANGETEFKVISGRYISDRENIGGNVCVAIEIESEPTLDYIINFTDSIMEFILAEARRFNTNREILSLLDKIDISKINKW